MKKATNDGKRGGTLEGKPHKNKQGKDVGGIKAVVTDAGNKPVELEGGEVIINKEASKKHWKLLSKINQSAGNGVPIHKPTDPHDEDPLEEYKGGGNIDFNVNHVPNKWILNYAKKIKEKHPEVWKLGGNIFGNEAFKNLSRVSERGYWLDSEEWMYKKWQSFLARHQHDFRIAGVIAMLKWAGKVNKGWAYMKDLIEAEIQKREGKKKKAKFKDGGSVEEDCIEFIKKSESIKTNGHYLHIKNLNIFVGEGDNVVPNVKSLLLITYNSGGQSNLKASETINASALSTEISKLIGGNINVARIIVSEQIRHAKIFSVSVLKGLENENIIVADRDRIVCTNLVPNYEDGGSVGFENELFDELAEHDAPSFKKGGNVVTYKQKFNRKYGFDKDESHSLAEISKLTKIKLSALQDIYDKGVGAYKTNPQSVRPNVKSKEQWAMARVYSAVMGGKAARVDANELERGRKYHLGGDMTKHLAPNGKPSNLTHEQWHLVRTPEFKAWFGDWENDPENASKVVDANGEPMVVWHTTDKEFTIFNKKKSKEGFFFSPKKERLSVYNKKNIAPYFLNLRNPSNELFNSDLKYLLAKGYDGIMDYGHAKHLGNESLYEIIAFEPNQIKLADGSNTTFDGGNPDIRYEDGGELAKGIKAEMEHKDTIDKFKKRGVSDRQVAESIAKDHLKEDPKYYTKLMKMESKKSDGGLVYNTKYAMWEGNVADALSDMLEISYNDAQGIIEANDYYVKEAFRKGWSSDATAKGLNKRATMFEDGGNIWRYPSFDMNEAGNFAATIDGKNYEVIYRDDKTQLYDLYEDGKIVKSDKDLFQLFKFDKGGNLEAKVKSKLSKSFALPFELAVYVPSTRGADEVISDAEFRARVKEVEVYLSNLFGGFSKSDIDGGYMSSEKGLITENVAKVTAFGQQEGFEDKLPQLIEKISDWCEKWTQESMGFEFEGDLFYVEKGFKYAGGGNISKKDKVRRVMHEYKQGTLHIGTSGKIVKDRQQAVAIALSEAGLSKKADGGGISINRETNREEYIKRLLDGVTTLPKANPYAPNRTNEVSFKSVDFTKPIRNDESRAFINTSIYTSEMDYVIGGFAHYKLNNIKVIGNDNPFSVAKLKILVRERIEDMIDDFKDEVSTNIANMDLYFDSESMDKDTEAEFNNLFKTYLSESVMHTDTERLAEQIMQHQSFNTWMARISQRVLEYQNRLTYKGEVNDTTGLSMNVSDIEEITYHSKLEQLLEKLSIITQQNHA